MFVIARTETPKRRRGRADLRIVFQNENRALHVRFKLDPETAYLRHIMRTEREHAESIENQRSSA